MGLRLKKAVMVHDSEKYPAGGPLTTLEKGLYARDIPEHMLEQLHRDHFEGDDSAEDPADALVSNRESRLHMGDDEGADA